MSLFLEAIQAAFFWMLDQFFVLINPLVSGLLGTFPDLIKTVGVGAEYVATANFFIPLDYGLNLALALFLFQGTFIGIKLVIKIFLPGIG
jgi:hypothetical protein